MEKLGEVLKFLLVIKELVYVFLGCSDINFMVNSIRIDVKMKFI